MSVALRFIPLCLFLLLLGLHFYMQTQFFLVGDVGYLLHVTQQLLQGATYGNGIFETNPPLILYLYTPVVLLAQMTGLNILLLIYLYTLGFALLSLASTYLLLKRLGLSEEPLSFWGFNYATWFAVLIFPLAHFAQREYFTFIFTLPYLLVLANRLQHKSIPTGVALCIGLFAGIGFGMKPYFLATFLLLEGYYLVRKRDCFAWLRPETVSVIILLLIYAGSILFFTRSYLTVLFPYIHAFYFAGTAQSYFNLFLNPLMIFCLFILICYFIFTPQNALHDLMTLVWLALLGMLIAVVIPKAPWFYHMLPACGYAFILIALYAGHALQAAKNRTQVLLIIFAVLFVMILPLQIHGQLFHYYKKNSLAVEKLSAYFASFPKGQTIACFSPSTTATCFPLIYLAHAHYTSPFPFFWWLRGILIKEYYPFTLPLPAPFQQRKVALMNKVADDLVQNKPQFIVMNPTEIAAQTAPGFDLLGYFSQNQSFHFAWQSYHYVKSVAGFEIYELNKGR